MGQALRQRRGSLLNIPALVDRLRVLAYIREGFHSHVRLVAQLLDRLVDRSGRSAGAILLGVLGDAAGVFRGGAGHVEQDDDRIGMQLPE